MSWDTHGWDIANTVGRILLLVVCIVKVTRFGETLNRVERFGIAMMGSGSLLTIDVIWQMQNSPYLDWSTGVITWGAVLAFSGRTWRDRKHEIRNWQAVRAARRHLEARGKL